MKLFSAQSGVSNVTGNSTSVETGLNNIATFVPSGMPNVSSVAPSVINKFGSISAATPSPLSILIKSNAG